MSQVSYCCNSLTFSLAFAIISSIANHHHHHFDPPITIIDFWTTKCVRCPAALDTLNTMASRPEYSSIKFTSIVLDDYGCDGARNIIEQPTSNKNNRENNGDELRWNNINHYYLDSEFKEIAKAALGFDQVPFYVVLNDKGEIVQKGSKKQIDFHDLPGIVRPIVPTVSEEEEKQSDEPVDFVADADSLAEKTERVFCLDDFDF